MFATDDTIVAIATPPGRAALGVVRLSGARAADIAAQFLERRDPLQPRHATFTRVRDNVDGSAALPRPRSTKSS